MAQRGNWGSSIGFVLAAAGSAVGLGNLWKFPYITWVNGGGSFVLIYLICIGLVGIPILVAEVTIGRSAQLSTVPALAFHTRGRRFSRFWTGAGVIGVATGGVILGYYAVIAGWSISSFAQCMVWSTSGYQAPASDAFGQFAANGPLQLGLSLLFSLATALIVERGVHGGIERASRLMMPALFAILLTLAVVACTLDGAGKTFQFLFTIGPITWHGVLEALGHAFFTLSLGMGAMITYGSYMKPEESLLRAAFSIALLDTLVALLACVVLYSILFTFPTAEGAIGSPVGMLFIAMPQLFYTSIRGGAILAPIFFILVAFAALTSTISMLEVVVAFAVDKLKWTRRQATLVAATVIFVLTAGCALSMGASPALTQFSPFAGAHEGLFGKLNHVLLKDKTGLFNVLDHLVSNWCLPIGGLLITFFAGWLLDRRLQSEQWKLDQASLAYRGLRLILRYLAPISIGLVLYGVNQS